MLKDEKTKNIRKDPRNFVDDLAKQAKEAVGKDDLKKIFVRS